MNKQEAAQFLGVSTRAIERYVAKGKLSATYIRGETGQRAIFSDEEVGQLKEELERPAYPVRPTVAPKSNDSTDRPDRGDKTDRPDRLDTKKAGLPVAVSQAVEAMQRNFALLDHIVAIEERQIAALEAIKPSRDPQVPIADKLTLNLAGAAALAGLSRSYLVEAIHEGKLKAAKRGRGWNIKRADLDAFIKKL